MEINKQINTTPEVQKEEGPIDAAISPQEKQLLDNAGDDEEDEIQKASLDNTDEDGEKLNEDSLAENRSGDDLDVPGAEEDDDNEAIGEEDEENNAYSLGGDDND